MIIKHILHTEAGIIGQKGMNSYGIELCLNALVSDKDKFKPNIPLLVLLRKILKSKSLI